MSTSRIPSALRDAASEFDTLPGVGPRAALRFAYWLVTQPRERIRRFAQALANLAEGIGRCSMCHAWTDRDICSVCSDAGRDRSTLCIVATSQDLQVIEDSGAFKGLYHVLGGLLDPIEGRTPETLSISLLLKRVKDNGTFREIILALDPDVSGDATGLYIENQLKGVPVTVTRLARGLPTGAQLEYADGATVANALANRKQTK